MTLNVKVVALIGLAVVGLGTAGFFVYKYKSKKVEDELTQLEIDWKKGEEDSEDEEDERVLDEEPLIVTGEDLAKLIVEKAVEDDKVNAKNGKNWDGTPREEWEPVPSVTKKDKRKSKTTDYASISNKLAKTPLDKVAKEKLGDDAVEPTEQDPDGPHVISLDEFAIGQRRGYDKMVLSYYSKDDVLCDPNNEVVAIPDDLLGEDGLLKFGNSSGDPDTVYIRNPLTSTDYEVVMLHESYQVKVLGIQPEKKRTKTRKVTRIDDDDNNE